MISINSEFVASLFSSFSMTDDAERNAALSHLFWLLPPAGKSEFHSLLKEHRPAIYATWLAAEGELAERRRAEPLGRLMEKLAPTAQVAPSTEIPAADEIGGAFNGHQSRADEYDADMIVEHWRERQEAEPGEAVPFEELAEAVLDAAAAHPQGAARASRVADVLRLRGFTAALEQTHRRRPAPLPATR